MKEQIRIITDYIVSEYYRLSWMEKNNETIVILLGVEIERLLMRGYVNIGANGEKYVMGRLYKTDYENPTAISIMIWKRTDFKEVLKNG